MSRRASPNIRPATTIPAHGVPLHRNGVCGPYGERARRPWAATSVNGSEKDLRPPRGVGAAMRKSQGQFPSLWAERLERCVSQHVSGPTRKGSPTTASLDISQVGTSVGDRPAFREHAFAHITGVSHRGSTYEASRT